MEKTSTILERDYLSQFLNAQKYMKEQERAELEQEAAKLGIRPEHLIARRNARALKEARQGWNSDDQSKAQRRARFIHDYKKERSRRKDNVKSVLGRVLSDDDAERLASGDFSKTEALMHSDSWMKSGIPILVLSGGVGSGKTFAAAKTLFDLLMRGELRSTDYDQYVYYRYTGLAIRSRDLASSMDPWKHELEAGIEKISAHETIFLLDDLGCERSDNQRFQESLEEFINRRSESGFRTIITTNLALVDIRGRYGDRIADRLNHNGKGIQLKSKSMRRQSGGF